MEDNNEDSKKMYEDDISGVHDHHEEIYHSADTCGRKHSHDHHEENLHSSDNCGHKHSHNHHHHDHHHDHEHSDGTRYEIPGFELLETHSHEGAVICSFEKMIDANIKISKEDAKIIDVKIKALEKWLEEKNAVIGHIKGFINEPEANVTFSTTGTGINYEEHKSDKQKMAFAAIVIGVAEEELKDKVVELFKNL